MVPTQDVFLHLVQHVDPLTSAFPSLDYLPSGVVAVVVIAFAIALVLSARRRDAD